jgi:hypothetical protein
MFAVDLRAVRNPHVVIRRFQPALSAVRPSVLSAGQRPNASPCHKRDRRFAPKKPPVPPARTLGGASRFPSAPCALLPRSFARVQLPTPFFSCAHTLFSKNTGGGVRRGKSCLRSMSCALRKTPITRKSTQHNPANRAAEPERTAEPAVRDSRVYVIVSGRAHVIARPVAPHHKLKIRGGYLL